MMKVIAVVVGFLVVLGNVTLAEAHRNDGLEGLIIGGAGGAAVGHVITGTPEGMIVGSFIGGTIGMLIDADNHRNRVVVIKERHRHHRRLLGYYDRGHWPQRGDRHYYGKRGHGERRWDRWGHRDHRRGRHQR